MGTLIRCKCGEAHRLVLSAFDNTESFGRAQPAKPTVSSHCFTRPFDRREKFQGLPPFSHSFIHSPTRCANQSKGAGDLPGLQVTQTAQPWDAPRSPGSRAAVSAPDRSRPRLTWFPVAGGSADVGSESAPAWRAAALRTRRPAVPEPLLQNPPAFRLCG